MWRVFPTFGLIKALLGLFAAFFLAALTFLLTDQNSGSRLQWNTFGEAFSLAAPVTIIFLIVIYFLGKVWWKAFWHLPWLGKKLNASVCPNLNGKWIGEVRSSYQTDGKPEVKVVDMEIKADMFGFEISLESRDGYQNSKVVQSQLYRDPKTKSFYLVYIFEAVVPFPEASDDRLFDGAAKLEVKITDSEVMLSGTYWTNRAWQREGATAGWIELKKSQS